MEERRDSKSILIVDDTALIRLMVKDILGAEGYDVETAAAAEEAILKIKSSKKELFDLVIVDIAEQVRHKIRDIDTVFEIDDSNLALILPITGAAAVAIVIKKIKDKLPGKWYFGVATYSDNGKDEQELINFAREDLMKKISDLKQETIETN